MKTIGEKWEILKPVYFWVFWISIILMPFLGGNNSKRCKTKTNPNKPGRLDQDGSSNSFSIQEPQK